MSLSGNNHSSGNSGSRTSIFETFHTPSFGDDNFEVQPQSIVTQPIKTYSRQPILAQAVLTVNKQSGSTSSLQSLNREEEAKTEEEEIFDEDEEEELSSSENAETTLWMSCSPGRDFTDEEEEEEEEEEVVPCQEEEEEEEGDKMEDESSDDTVPLSKLAGKRFLEKGLKPPSVKRSKPAKPLKLAKDKKAPKKPLSAYAFFYRDTQMAIKSQNPQATFGEISKIVASMWDRLDGELKEEYNRRAEENKKEYIQMLAEYCALNKDKIQPSVKSKQKKSKKPSSSKPKPKPLESESHSESQDGVAAESEPKDETDNFESSQRSSESSERMASPKQEEKQDKPRPICNYTKCQNPAIDDPRWEKNYCSSECVIAHCKDVFNAWVANRKSAYCET